MKIDKIMSMATNQLKHTDVAAMRISYTQGELLESNVSTDPFIQFDTWFNETKRDIPPPFESNAMCLSTASSTGRPSARMVLLKDYNENGFIFFSNYNSNKAKQIKDNPFAGNLFKI